MYYWCLLVSACFTLRANCQDIGQIESLIELPVIAFNAFPNDDVAAFVLFEEGRLNRIPYGEYLQEDIFLEANDDYLLEFRQRLSEEVVLDFTTYGFVGSNVEREREILLVMGTLNNTVLSPFADTVTFDTNIEDGFSKLYLYNAVSSRERSGLNFYSLYLRTNADGSQSESIAQLASGVETNSGRDVSVQPNLDTQIKGFYHTVNSVDRFKLDTEVVTIDYLHVDPGKRYYIIAYGIEGSETTPPTAKVVAAEQTSSGMAIKSTILLVLALLVSAII